MPHILSLDIGGTKIAAAAISPTGDILARTDLETRAHEGAPIVISRIIETLNALKQPDPLLGIGIGCTGPVDPRTGHVMNPYTLPTWDDVDLVSPLVSEFHCPVVLENDCDAAVLGEVWRGAAQGAQNAIYVTIGTGIGAGLYLQGKLYRGVGWVSGEFGHTTIDYGGFPCYCGSHGCLEMYAAGPAIAAVYTAKKSAANALAPTNPLSLTKQLIEPSDQPSDQPTVPPLSLSPSLNPSISPSVPAQSSVPAVTSGAVPPSSPTAITAREVLTLAANGDPDALTIVEHAARFLGIGLGNLVSLLAPDIILLGGGVMERFDLFEPTLRATIDQCATLVPAAQVKLLRAALIPNAGLIGAARALLDRLPAS